MKQPFTVNNFITPPSTELSPFLTADNQLVICDGVNPCYKLGELRKDTGYTLLGTQIHSGKSINSLYYFIQSASTKKLLAITNDATGANTELWYSTGGNFSQIAFATWNAMVNMKVEFAPFLGYCFFVGYNGSTFLPVASLTGTTMSTTTNVTSMPQAKYITRYRDRLYIANSYNGSAQPYRVYFSSVPTAGAITWTPATDFLDVDYALDITGISQNWDRLMIFTSDSAYMYDQLSLKKVFDTGCDAHRTIKNHEAFMLWANNQNVYVSVSGGRPQAIGNDILELIRNASSSAWNAEIVENEYHLYLGTTSANGITYTNCLATYNIDKGMWRWRELHDSLQSMTTTDFNSHDRVYFGDTDGKVYAKGRYTDAYYSDNGKPILSWFRTKAYDFASPQIEKRLEKIVAYALQAGNLELYARAFNRNHEILMPFESVGALRAIVNELPKTVNGYFIQIEGKEMGTSQPWIFYGMSMMIESNTTQT